MPNIWRLISHYSHPEAAVDWARANGRIAIGWGGTGDIRAQGYASPKDIVKVVRERYPQNYNAPFSGIQLWNFCYTIKPDDLVILSTGKRRALVMQVDGDYEYRLAEKTAIPGDLCHQRAAHATAIDPDRLWRLAGSAMAAGQSIRWTLIQCLRPVQADALS